MTTENFTTYTEVDPNNRLTVTADRVAWAGLRDDDSSYDYDDKGVDHFGVDFEHLIDYYLDAAATDSYVSFWTLTDHVNILYWILANSQDALGVFGGYNGASYCIHVFEIVAGTLYFSPIFVASLDTSYYLKIKRDSGVGTYGTLYCHIYSDSARENLLATRSLALHDPAAYENGDAKFRYIYPVNGTFWGYAAAQTGYCENLDLQEAGLQIIEPSSIASEESFGTPTILPGAVIISPSAIPSGESFGIPALVYGQNIFPSSIVSLEAFGTPTIIPGAVIISPSAIVSLEAFGTPKIVPGSVIISPSSIASLEAFGTPFLVYGQTISPSSIASLEAFGTPTVILVTTYDEWTYWNVDAFAVALCAYDAAVFAFRMDATDGHLYLCASGDNAESWGSWIDLGDVSGTVTSRLSACFKDADEAIVLYSIGGTLYRRRWNGSTWETAAAWSNSLSSINGIAVTYMGDWNVIVTGVDPDGRRGVWSCVLGNGYSAAVDTWSALKEVMISESGANVVYHSPSLSMPDVFRMFFVEYLTAAEVYQRPYWSHSLATADFISNLWREPVPFNLSCTYGLDLCYRSPYAWLSRASRVWRAPISPPSVELTDSLLSVSSVIIPYRGGVDISLRNDDRRFNSPGQGDYEAIKKSSEILISWGYHTPAGKETGGFDPTTWIDSWEYVTRDGHSEFILHCFDGWDLLDRWKARRQFTWSYGSKNIYQLLALIFARAGLELSAFSTSTAIVNQYPAFTINPGESGLTAVKRLLAMVPDVIFFVRDTAYLKNPLAADSSQYSYGTDHRIIEASYRELAQKANRAQVFGVSVFTEDWDWDEIALVYDRLVQASDINIYDATKAHQRGSAILRGEDIAGIDGHILVPMNCGQDLFDVVAITSPQTGLNASKRRVLSLTRTWTPNKPKSRYTLTVGLGAP